MSRHVRPRPVCRRFATGISRRVSGTNPAGYVRPGLNRAPWVCGRNPRPCVQHHSDHAAAAVPIESNPAGGRAKSDQKPQASNRKLSSQSRGLTKLLQQIRRKSAGKWLYAVLSAHFLNFQMPILFPFNSHEIRRLAPMHPSFRQIL